MELKELFIGYLSSTLNIDANGVASLLNEDGSVKEDSKSKLLTLHEDHIRSIKSGTTKSAFDDGYKKGQKESLSNLEKDFKEKTGFKSDKIGVDLFLEYAKEAGKGELNDDNVKKHPFYLQMLENKEKEKNDVLSKVQSEFNDYKLGVEKKEIFSKVNQKALSIFKSLNPVLSSDESKATNQLEIVTNNLKGFDYEIQGERVVVLKDGKIHEDQHGKAIYLDDLVKNITSKYFDLHDKDAKVPPVGSNQVAAQVQKKFNIQVPKNSKEVEAYIMDRSIPLEQRKAMQVAFEKGETSI